MKYCYYGEMQVKYCQCCGLDKDLKSFKKTKGKYKDFCKECYITFDRQERKQKKIKLIYDILLQMN